METYEWLQKPFFLTPYAVSKGLMRPEDLVRIYWRLKEEDLYRVVFHDNPDMDLLQFMNFFSSPAVLLQVVHFVEGDQIKDISGLSWLVGLEQYAGRQRATGSFLAFRKYQTPTMTEHMAKMVLQYWFEQLKMDIVTGMTPEENVLALRFIKRIGFQELCRIPDYMALNGKITDCIVTMMNAGQYRQMYTR